MRSAVFTGISAIWNFCNFWNSKQKFEIPALLQGGTICLVSPVKNSELSNKNCRRSSDLKQKWTDGRRTTTDDDGRRTISNTISSAELMLSAELKTDGSHRLVTAFTTRSTQRAQTSLAEADHYSHIVHCKNVEPWL